MVILTYLELEEEVMSEDESDDSPLKKYNDQTVAK